jgi:hypothetical protein
MAVKYFNIFQNKSLQNFPTWIFFFENKSSGNPAYKLALGISPDTPNSCLRLCKNYT